jgi:hypothetical protein
MPSSRGSVRKIKPASRILPVIQITSSINIHGAESNILMVDSAKRGYRKYPRELQGRL